MDLVKREVYEKKEVSGSYSPTVGSEGRIYLSVPSAAGTGRVEIG